ncbi:hypothetical protein NDU88_005951 [Pleurodeles waltl]|uniref:Uncharacterized protein n=1 Tax=Pleurodeles waltl TaxID=8319 RepID=A0AAV7RLP9_PLEWA|nr:hypothetical protein NDU88_005951 [Pleurodeles waltl]
MREGSFWLGARRDVCYRLGHLCRAVYSLCMAAYNDELGDEYYVDDPAGSFEQDLVYALDACVRHMVYQALDRAIRPSKHLIGYAEQQGWVAPSGSQMLEEHSLSGGSQALKQGRNPHTADFESLIRTLAREHDYNTSSTPKSKSKNYLDSSSSGHSSDQGDDPTLKRKQKTHHQDVSIPTPKVLTFDKRALFIPDLPYGRIFNDVTTPD